MWVIILRSLQADVVDFCNEKIVRINAKVVWMIEILDYKKSVGMECEIKSTLDEYHHL